VDECKPLLSGGTKLAMVPFKQQCVYCTGQGLGRRYEMLLNSRHEGSNCVERR